MDLQTVTVTDIKSVITVYSPRGRRARIEKRATYGLSLCIDGKITYTQNGVNYTEDRAHAVILPEGQSYSLQGDSDGYFPVINFSLLEPLCDTITVFEIQNSESLLKSYERLKKIFSSGGSRAKALSLLYDILGELSSQRSAGIIDLAIRAINERYSDPTLTNSLLAECCGISEVYFRKLFHLRFGMSPSHYIMQTRISHAVKLMQLERLSLDEISEKIKNI